MKSRNIKCIWLIAQGFLHGPDIDYKETYSAMMDTIIFRYVNCLAISEGLDLRLMDVVTAYLHGSLDNNIHIWKSLKDFKCLKQLIQNVVAYTQLSYKDPYIKQSKYMSYNYFNEYLKWEVYVYYLIWLCIFIMLNICNCYSICGIFEFCLNS